MNPLEFLISKLTYIIPAIFTIIGAIYFYLKGKNSSQKENLEKSVQFLREMVKKVADINSEKDEIKKKIEVINKNSDGDSRDRELSELLSSDPFKSSKTTRPNG